ncbi:hypothetical protein [Roseovarius ramblicola]|uniref:PE-PGRS family protein n=1 Tax=Roseovarius ramblicola TaxID=2022336 RepID=A0ABV5I4H1_9RHOB
MTLPSTGIFDGAAAGGGGGGGTFTATISTNQQEMNLATWATGQGWDGTSYAEITVAAGVYVWSDDTAIPGMTTGAFPGGLKLIVEGYIIGKGGTSPNSGTTGGNDGGPALSLGTDVTIEGGTNGYVAGGGGSGANIDGNSMTGGGGAGGGNSGDDGGTAGATGGAVGFAGADGGEVGQLDRGYGGGSGGGGAGTN